MREAGPSGISSEDAKEAADSVQPSASKKLDVPELPLDFRFESLSVAESNSTTPPKATPEALGLPLLEGIVVSYSIRFQSGFLKVDKSDENAYVHYSQIEMAGFRCLHEGQRCRFFAYRTTKGLRAVKVTPLDSGQMGGELRPGREHFKNEKCYNCGRKGHKSKFCWEKAKDVCYYCKKPGHLSAECPKKQRKKEEKTFEKHEDEPVITSQEAKKEPLKKPKPPGRNSRKPQMSNSSRVSIPSKPIPLREVCRQMQKATIVAQAVMAVKASDSNPLLREQPKRSRSF